MKAHKRYHFGFAKAILIQNGIKRGSVFPGHFDDTVEVGGREGRYRLHVLSNCTTCPIVLPCFDVAYVFFRGLGK
jgi:hypothetical protein